MQNSAIENEILEGIREVIPVTFAVAVFGLLFGATAVNSNFSLPESAFASALILAGASQFVLLELYNLGSPVWSILAAVFAVNFRHVLYSASLGRHLKAFSGKVKYLSFFLLSDPVFGASIQRVQTRRLTPAFYFGYAILPYCAWISSTIVGAYFGALITDPKALGMDMLLSIYFVSLVMGFRSQPGWLPVVLASGIASVVIYRTIGAPWHITLGAAVGIFLAACIGKPKSELEKHEEINDA